MSEVTATRTKYSASELGSALKTSFRNLYGVLPSQNLASMLLALILLETANGAALWNNNVGNVIITNPDQNWFRLGSNTNQFRAYDRLDQGLSNFLHEVVTRRPSMVRAAEAGDANAFAVAYRDTKYAPDADPAKVGPTFAKMFAANLGAGYFADCPLKTDLTIPSGSSKKPSLPASGGALLLMGAGAAILFATTRIKPGRRVPA